MNTRADRNIAIVAHKFTTQPDDNLLEYLNEKKYRNVMHIYHSFDDAKDRKSFVKWYKSGELYLEKSTKDYKQFPEPLIYLKELIFTFYWALRLSEPWDYLIAMDGLCAFFGNCLKLTGRVKKTVYWAIDFVPESRFKSGLKNRIYHLINIHGYKSSDEMWDLSPRMAEAREKYLGVKQKSYKERKTVPYGLMTEKIKRYAYNDCEKNTLVFMGHLIEKQGVQLIISAMPKILSHNPNFKFKIIGTGRYESELKKLAEKLDVQASCTFVGKIENYSQMQNEIARSCAAVAPYVKKLDTWTYFADPGKLKEYLACGIPVLVTEVPWNAKDIESHQCGKIIKEDLSDIANKIMEIMSPEENQKYRDNAIVYAQSFGYTNIFKELGF